jgi:hypothetical protein
MTVTFRCPVCGLTVTTHLPSATADTCAHRGTVHDAKKPSEMKRETPCD